MTKAEQDTPTSEKTLKRRTRVGKKGPEFVRQESWRHKRLRESWRRPRGIDNKMRRKIKGWPPTVNIGYRGARGSRGLHPSGYYEVLVHNTGELEKADSKTHAIRIAHTVGKRERAKILAEARKRRIMVLNLKEAKEAIREEALEEEKEEKELEEEKPRHTQQKIRKRRRRTKSSG